MKTTIKSFAYLLTLLAFTFMVTSCSSDDDNGTTNPPIEGEDTELGGDFVTENLTLDATLDYTLNGILTVESGATLTIPAGTSITTGTGTNVYIVVQKGADIVINGTESNPVVMKPGGTGVWGGLVIAGNATTTEGVDAVAEVGGILYGGTDDNDSSGSISYLLLSQTGAQINPESQFNGLTLYAVGSGTTLENIAVLGGQDDGVEFFGGSANVTNFYAENLQDDAVDWTEGWNGTLENAYILHTDANFSTAVEADGQNGNPTLQNLTAVSTVGGTALQFKAQSGATINNISLSGYETSVDMRDDGPLANVQIDGADADPAMGYTGPATVDINMFDWATGNSGNQSEILSGSITGDVSLDVAVNYQLPGILSVEDGATLTIPAGTNITTGTGTDVYLVVQKGGTININGTEANPVVMEPGVDGVWGGLVIAGKAITTEGIDAVAEVGGILYGGTDAADNSGSINYLILKDTGAQINPESQFNGLTLYAVGSGTTLENIAVLGGQDDGVEFFGGSANVTNFYTENMEDDAVDWTEGWDGTLTNAYILHTDANFSTAVEADGQNGNPTLQNLTAVSTVGGTALQFKAQSGATINNISLSGYETSVDMRDNGPLANVQIDGADADPALGYTGPATVDVTMFEWATGDDSSVTEVLSGNISGNKTLDANVNYQLPGILSVEDGATLTIPAGTNITTGTGTDVYLVVQKGGTININGTETNPVVMEPGVSGVWGGLVIAGKAITTEGIDAVAEVGGILYGGTDATDNSGSINYLVLKNTGAQINPESQFNGLTLYAVGSGTTLENIAVLGGQDDGVEFFGGSANVTNFYALNMEDDAVDWTEGWDGVLTNTFVKHTDTNFSTALEADGFNNNPTINNFVAENTNNSGTALQFKASSGATFNGLSLTGYNTIIDMRDNGPLSNVQIDGADGDPNATYDTATVTEADFSWATN
ncbi:hypothetical protein [Flavobacterium sp. CS20]|uniref:beta strand repeat-containing protein n=1 Tax=Flavobacterium sp. CS20 TaxID=2775246 RepID=UPI001FFD5683|nr:hypothetical protein [Flavobacterium sp. CS20]